MSTTIKAKVKVEANPLGLPRGSIIDMFVEIFDGYAMIHTSNDKFTKDLVRTAKPDEKAVFNERLRKTIVQYPGKTEQEISEKIGKELASLQ
jgi:hypothetical protein